jgi:hypothetical protein
LEVEPTEFRDELGNMRKERQRCGRGLADLGLINQLVVTAFAGSGGPEMRRTYM